MIESVSESVSPYPSKNSVAASAMALSFLRRSRSSTLMRSRAAFASPRLTRPKARSPSWAAMLHKVNSRKDTFFDLNHSFLFSTSRVCIVRDTASSISCGVHPRAAALVAIACARHISSVCTGTPVSIETVSNASLFDVANKRFAICSLNCCLYRGTFISHCPHGSNTIDHIHAAFGGAPTAIVRMQRR
ncbi:hypothetical protein LMG24235_08565 [Paraburkholderia sabiae]|nr:hypothetical protein LMG24235_08565 [Paraburkholderia sabiae]